MASEPKGPSTPGPLYERLGGWGGIAVVAEFWCDRVLTDPQLASHFAGAHASDLKRAQTEFLVHLAGGPVRSPLQPLPPLYALLPQTEWHAERLSGHLIAALVWANVPRPTIEDVLDALTPLNPPTRSAPGPDES